MFCEKCGRELKDEWKVCPKCGEPVIKSDNEEKNIKETVERLKESVSSVDYVVINDCSKDGTEKILKNLGIT